MQKHARKRICRVDAVDKNILTFELTEEQLAKAGGEKITFRKSDYSTSRKKATASSSREPSTTRRRLREEARQVRGHKAHRHHFRRRP